MDAHAAFCSCDVTTISRVQLGTQLRDFLRNPSQSHSSYISPVSAVAKLRVPDSWLGHCSFAAVAITVRLHLLKAVIEPSLGAETGDDVSCVTCDGVRTQVF
jgi:hypothetical protein